MTNKTAIPFYLGQHLENETVYYGDVYTFKPAVNHYKRNSKLGNTMKSALLSLFTFSVK